MESRGELGRAAALAWLRDPATLSRMRIEPVIGALWRWPDEAGAAEGIGEAFDHFRSLGVLAGSSSSVTRYPDDTFASGREVVVAWAEVPALLARAPFLTERIGPIPSPLLPAPSWPDPPLPWPPDEALDSSR